MTSVSLMDSVSCSLHLHKHTAIRPYSLPPTSQHSREVLYYSAGMHSQRQIKDKNEKYISGSQQRSKVCEFLF